MFTIFGCGGHVTRTRSRIQMSLYLKFEFNWPSGFRGDDV